MLLSSCSEKDLVALNLIDDSAISNNYVYFKSLDGKEIYNQIKEETLSNLSGTRSSLDDENKELDIFNGFNFNHQEVLSDNTNSLKVILIGSTNATTINSTNTAQYLCSTIDTRGQILTQKIVRTEFDGDNVYVSFFDLYGTFCYKIKSNVKDKKMSVMVYNKERYGNLNEISTRAADLGCSASLMAASLPWTIGFGMINPLAGAAAGIIFWGLSQAMC